MAAVRVLCVGLATLDLVQRVPRLPGPDEKVQAASVDVAAGGPAAGAAVAAAALGARVVLVTAVGAHPLGDLVRADLHACGVRLHDAAAGHPGVPPLSAVAVLEGTGQRSVVSRNAAGTRVGVPDALAGLVDAADVVLVDGHHPAPAVAAARAAAAAGRPLVVDAGHWRPVFADLLPHAAVVACSAAFRHPAAGPDPDGAATVAALRAAGVPHLAVTDGPDPVRWWSRGAAGAVAVPPVTARDTAGAGDVFHGALAVAAARDPRLADLPGALRYAVAAAGLRVAHAGPRAWLADPRLAALAG